MALVSVQENSSDNASIRFSNFFVERESVGLIFFRMKSVDTCLSKRLVEQG